MASLSVVMIVRDEADCLAACLDSVRAVAGEIVVADTGSTDDSVAVAARFGARVLHVPWRDDFAAARNEALAAATGDWLLHVDADEILDPSGAESMHDLLCADGNGADAIEVTLRNYCNDIRAWRWQVVEPRDPFARGYAGYLPVGLLRLFRNGRGFEYREPVHESISESVVERGGVIATAPIVIHHYGFETTPEKVAEKRRRYYAIAKTKSAQRPRDPKAWHDLAEQALAVGETAVAEGAARKALEIDPVHLPAATTLGTILLNRGDIEGARTLFERVEAKGIRVPHVATALGAIACKQGRLDEAHTRLQTVANEYPKDIQSRLYLARVSDRTGASDAARTRLVEALAIAPSLPELEDRLRAHDLREEARQMLAVATDAGRISQAMRLLVKSLRLDPEDSIPYRALGAALESLGRHDQAKAQFDRADRLEGIRN
ncbi:MAG: glycosyltransferase [Candidatus Hydrogenedentes bacterium]|nr:glycosyltransferase [Candidatus Hydrogenedentota bacterium]